VEHDEEKFGQLTILLILVLALEFTADNIIQGNLSALLEANDSSTGAYLSGRQVTGNPAQRR